MWIKFPFLSDHTTIAGPCPLSVGSFSDGDRILVRNLGAHDALAQIGLAGCWLDRHIPSLSRVIYALHRQVCQAAVSCRIRLGQPGRNPQKAKRRGPIREPRL